MDRAINAPSHGNNVVYGLNATYKLYLNEQIKFIDKLSSNDTSNIGIIHSDSKYVSIKFSYQCIHIISNKEGINGVKGSTKIQNRESPFKYQ